MTSRMSLVEQPEDRSIEAWERVIAGFDAALRVADLPPDLRGRLIRCRRHASRAAGARPLASATTPRGDVA